jgi:hypothetical protein
MPLRVFVRWEVPLLETTLVPTFGRGALFSCCANSSYSNYNTGDDDDSHDDEYEGHRARFFKGVTPSL